MESTVSNKNVFGFSSAVFHVIFGLIVTSLSILELGTFFEAIEKNQSKRLQLHTNTSRSWQSIWDNIQFDDLGTIAGHLALWLTSCIIIWLLFWPITKFKRTLKKYEQGKISNNRFRSFWWLSLLISGLFLLVFFWLTVDDLVLGSILIILLIPQLFCLYLSRGKIIQ